MPLDYAGVYNATQAPSSAPGLGIVPTARLPVAGEAVAVGTSLYQWAKGGFDIGAWLMRTASGGFLDSVLNRVNVWAAKQEFQPSADDVPAFQGIQVPTTRQALLEWTVGSVWVRVYALVGGPGYEVTVNAKWKVSSTKWGQDTNTPSLRFQINQDTTQRFSFDYIGGQAGVDFTDASWTHPGILNAATGALTLLGAVVAAGATITGTFTQSGGVFSLTGSNSSVLTTILGSLLVDAAGLVGIGTVDSTGVIIGRSGKDTSLESDRMLPGIDGTTKLGDTGNRYGEVWGFTHAGATQTINDAASITIDPTIGETVRVLLGATLVAAVTISAGKPGQLLVVEVIQDGTGGRGIVGPAGANTWTNVKMTAAYTVSPGANKRDLLTFRYDSTDALWYEQGRAMNMG